MINAVDLACTIIVAFASWHLIEKHFLELKQHPSFQVQPYPLLIDESLPSAR
jgi:peptidoglycan/LPS O-acetylase OafA/YrhL